MNLADLGLFAASIVIAYCSGYIRAEPRRCGHHRWARFAVLREYDDGTVDGFEPLHPTQFADALHKRCRRCGAVVAGNRCGGREPQP